MKEATKQQYIDHITPKDAVLHIENGVCTWTYRNGATPIAKSENGKYYIS